jgi:predicted acyl esterase
MYGISWGGFNALQMAMRRPPALKAILAACATNDLFVNDVRFMDGIMHIDQYEMAIDLLNAIAPSPGFPLDEKTLQERFDSSPWFLAYKRHQRDGPFWKEPEKPLEKIDIPVFLIGGFYDGYRDSIPRMLEGLKGPVKAVIGPWNHVFPDGSAWEPRIEWRDDAIAWWDHWLKGVQNGTMEEPKLVVYMRHWYPPGLDKQTIPGTWRAESGWPPRDAASATFYLRADHSLGTSAPATGMHQLNYVPSAGVEAGGTNLWWGELRQDLAPSDAFSLVYDSAALEDDLAILGTPQVRLNASAAAPLADWIARLSDVAPDGSVTLHFLGVSARASNPVVGFKCSMAHAVADALPDDDGGYAGWRAAFENRAARGSDREPHRASEVYCPPSVPSPLALGPMDHRARSDSPKLEMDLAHTRKRAGIFLGKNPPQALDRVRRGGCAPGERFLSW